MRRRYQRGCLLKVSGSWVAKWREQGRQRKKTIGRLAEMSKTEARLELDKILSGIQGPARQSTIESFVEGSYLPFYREKWKASTLETNQGRIRNHILGTFGDREVGSFNRAELQAS